jgi:hypothetical protein
MTPTPQVIMARFHLDLSDAHPNEDYWLRADGKNHPLRAHTPETRARARLDCRQAAEMSDAELTHFTDEIALPSDVAMLLHVKHSAHHIPGMDPDTPVPSITTLYVPPRNGHSVELTVSYKTTVRVLAFCHPDLVTKNPDLARAIWDEMTDNKKLKQMFDDLGSLIKKWGPPATSENAGWATLVKFYRKADPNVTVPDPNDPSKTVSYPGVNSYFVNPNKGYLDAAGPAQTKLLIAIKNSTDAALQSKYWKVDYGSASLPATAPVSPEGGGAASLADTGLAARVQATATDDNWSVALTNTERTHGLKVALSDLDAANKRFTITFSDNDIRYLGYYAIFYDAHGNKIGLKNWTPDGETGPTSLTYDLRKTMGGLIESDTVQFIGYSSGVTTVLGVPTVDGTLTLTITMPQGAVAAEFFGAGLGMCGMLNYSFAPRFGGALTGLVDLVIPILMLISSASDLSSATTQAEIDKLLKGKWKFAVAQMTYYVADLVLTWRDSKSVSWSDLISIAKVLFAPISLELLIFLEAKMATEEAAEAVPFAGWALFALQLSVGVITISETVVEIATSPWQIPVGVKSTITSQVTVHPDPVAISYPYPSEAATLSVTMTYKKAKRQSVFASQQVPANHDSDDLLVAVFPNNTLGGQVKFDVTYLVNGWVAAQASSGWMDNTEANCASVTLYLVENPIPLDAGSVYRQTNLLTWQNGVYGWQATDQNPTATVASANSASTGNAISVWRGLTLSQRYGALGYAWAAAGTGVASCDGTSDGQTNVMQNINIPGTGMAGAAFPSCGFAGPDRMLYDPGLPKYLMAGDPPQYLLNDATNPPTPVPDPSDRALGDYFVDPRSADVALADGGGYHLRFVDLTGTQQGTVSFDMSPDQQSHGRFATYQASLAMHPQGYAIGVDAVTCKLSILELAEHGVPDVYAPMAIQFAGEALAKGRIGLLFRPVAVTCSGDGTILVLEETKGGSDDFATIPAVARLQAFDLSGNSVACFRAENGSASAVLQLEGEGDYTYLDACAVGDSKQTYVFVLYYSGNGHDPSQYHMSIYQFGTDATDENPLVTSDGVAAAALCVDNWHQLYTLNYAMTTDESGNPAGPSGAGTGPAGRTVPALGQWLPPIGNT